MKSYKKKPFQIITIIVNMVFLKIKKNYECDNRRMVSFYHSNFFLIKFKFLIKFFLIRQLKLKNMHTNISRKLLALPYAKKTRQLIKLKRRDFSLRTILCCPCYKTDQRNGQSSSLERERCSVQFPVPASETSSEGKATSSACQTTGSFYPQLNFCLIFTIISAALQ